MKCENCNGTGYDSAAKNMPKDTPSMFIPMGVWPCSFCNGSGERKDVLLELTEQEDKALWAALRSSAKLISKGSLSES